MSSTPTPTPLPAVYVATMNIPGYLPMDDEPPYFSSAADAWQWLAEERKRAEDDAADETTEGTPYTDTVEELRRQSEIGTVYGSRPDLEPTHDLGLAYCVDVLDVRLNSDGDAIDVQIPDRCGWQTSYGAGGETYCVAESDPASIHGWCTRHQRDAHENYPQH